MSLREAYVIDAVRTPFGRYGGALARVRPDDLAAHVVRTLGERNPGLDPARVAAATQSKFGVRNSVSAA